MSIWEKKYDITLEFILREPLGTLGPELNRRNWKFHSLPYGFWSESNPTTTPEVIHRAALQNSKAVLQIEKIIQGSKPDIVLTNSVVCPWAAIAAYYQNVPHVWFVREYGDLDHGRVFQLSQQETFEDVGFLSKLVITNSKALASHVKQYVPEHKVTTLYHPFNVDALIKQAKEPVKSPYKSDESFKLVLSAGSVTETKGFLEAVTAVGELNKSGQDSELCIIGKTHEKEFMAKLRSRINDYNIEDKIHFIGFQKNPLPYVALTDVGIMASRMEAFGRVTFEYMALGKPVVGVGAGGTLEMVVDGHNGYLFKYRNTESLTEALTKYAIDKNLITKHGQNSFKLTQDMLSGEYNIDALFEKLNQSIKVEQEIRNTVFHYSHMWLTYPSFAEQYMRSQSSMSVKKLIRSRVKSRTKNQVTRAKAFYRRRTK
ncbi:MAG: glycosyltransferase [bacterium]|nr:glycosyltransferase [bacterium]